MTRVAPLDVTLEKDGARRRWVISPNGTGGAWLVPHQGAFGVEMTHAKLAARRRAFVSEIAAHVREGWHIAASLQPKKAR